MKTEKPLSGEMNPVPMPSSEIVTLTDRAAKKVREYFAQQGDGKALLRVSLARTHCMGGRGYGYTLAPEGSIGAEDIAQVVHGLTIVIKRDDAPRLARTVIDYVEGFEKSGFAVENPQSSGKCPCGHHDLFD